MSTFRLDVPPCPFCGAEPRYRRVSSYLQRYPPAIWSDKHKIVGSRVFPLVCTQCGYVQDFVDPQDFRQEQTGGE